MMRFEYSIISLSFHPWGHYLAVASGSKLEMWKWMKGADAENEIESVMSKLPPNKRELMLQSNELQYLCKLWKSFFKFYSGCSGQSKTIAHFRNIRAVVFHPFGLAKINTCMTLETIHCRFFR